MRPYTLKYYEPESATPLRLPMSKSIAARLLAIAYLTHSNPHILLSDFHPLCDDLQVLLTGVEKLQECKAESGERRGNRNVERCVIELHDSGTAKHILTALAACTPGVRVELRMSRRLAQRPMDALLNLLHLFCSARVSISGDSILIEGGDYIGIDLPLIVDLSHSSQAATAFMLVAAGAGSSLYLTPETEIVSSPYIEITAALLRKCGVDAEFSLWDKYLRVKGGTLLPPSVASIEADWSAASYWYLYTLLSGNSVELIGLKRLEESMQGDSICAPMFEALGVKTSYTGDVVRLERCERKNARFDADMREYPDLVISIAVACVLTGVPFNITGISHLRIKESNRLNAISEALSLFGAKVNVRFDSLEYRATNPLHSPLSTLHSYHDHRMAMALTMTAVRFPGIVIDDMDCIKKSYPEFLSHIESMGIIATEI